MLEEVARKLAEGKEELTMRWLQQERDGSKYKEIDGHTPISNCNFIHIISHIKT